MAIKGLTKENTNIIADIKAKDGTINKPTSNWLMSILVNEKF